MEWFDFALALGPAAGVFVLSIFFINKLFADNTGERKQNKETTDKLFNELSHTREENAKQLVIFERAVDKMDWRLSHIESSVDEIKKQRMIS